MDHALPGCRFLVSPLLEVLLAAEVLLGRHPAPQGRRLDTKNAQRHTLGLRPDVIRQGIKVAAGRLLHDTSTNRQQPDLSALGPLEKPARTFFETCLADDWPRIRATLEADIAHRAHQLASRGVRQVVEHLPGLTVREGEEPASPRDCMTVLVPTAFQKTRILLADATGAVITYPAVGQHNLWNGSQTAAPGRLGALLGRGRAAALVNIGDGCGTTDLADRLGVSAGTASVHVTALRNGGLVATHRTGKAVRHVLTPIGSALITTLLDPVSSALTNLSEML
ncbi:winged helix-turn-helix transcriptional regulator [Streptomyces sp. SID14478]|uniref:winged helix-turn-helix domain-containing protein n=1 Tax=Streptomyces sp. SID14478 TaxID=2706073 RepID=UPI0013DBC11A|nr:winged helix-turn-helix domain-containing protein [Streptomyces sp. SID14478]NEB73644.1 winged helix-turn-helix transcriptional regulator [Streptomyces sp. SID14478]